MSIKIKSFPASNGESFLVKLIGEKTSNIIIDCGYDSTAKYIIAELDEMKRKKESLELIVFTHIDNDHINGARKLLDYIITNKYEFGEVWYNDYIKISGASFTEEKSNEKCEFIDNICDISYKGENGIYKKGQVGYYSATSLIEYLSNDFIKDKWNKSFQWKSVNVKKGCLKRIELTDKISIVLLSPCEDILMEQLKEWEIYLENHINKRVKSKKIALAFEKYFMVLRKDKVNSKKSKCSNQEIDEMLEDNEFDKDIVNRSSISFVIEYEKKKLLFLGDSSPIDITDQIFKYLEEESSNSLDLVKVSHHGSKKSISKNLIKKIDCENFIIATDGSLHKHPDIQSIIKIIKLGNKQKKVYINYKPNIIFNILNSLGENFEQNIIYENENKLDKKIQSIFL